MTEPVWSRQELLEFYKIAIEEQHREIDAHQRRVSFIVGLQTAVFGGTVAGLWQSSEWFHFLLLMLGPILAVIVAHLGRLISEQFYQRFLDSIVLRAKIEQLLGMTAPLTSDHETDYWKGEALISTRHLKSRRAKKDSGHWFTSHLESGYHNSIVRLMGVFIWIAIFAGVILLGIGVSEVINSKSKTRQPRQEIHYVSY